MLAPKQVRQWRPPVTYSCGRKPSAAWAPTVRHPSRVCNLQAQAAQQTSNSSRLRGRSLSPPSIGRYLPPSSTHPVISLLSWGETFPLHFPLGLRGSHVLLAVARRPDRATKSFWKRELGVRSRFLSPCVVKKASWNLMLEAVDCRANGLQTKDQLVYEEVLQDECPQNKPLRIFFLNCNQHLCNVNMLICLMVGTCPKLYWSITNQE